MDDVARVMVAVFNSRSQETVKNCVLVAGLDLHPGEITKVTVTGVIVDKTDFELRLRDGLKQGVGIHDDDRPLNEDELDRVQTHFVDTQCGASLLCVTVAPTWEVSQSL